MDENGARMSFLRKLQKESDGYVVRFLPMEDAKFRQYEKLVG